MKRGGARLCWHTPHTHERALAAPITVHSPVVDGDAIDLYAPPPAMTIQELLRTLADNSSTAHGKGAAFERFNRKYLMTDPVFKRQFAEVWLWMDWPHRGSQPDTGIDLVGRRRDGSGFCAIQCKFYGTDHTMQKSDIDSFFTASGKTFQVDGESQSFTSRLIISTTDKWSKHAEEAIRGQTIPTTRFGISSFEESGIDWKQFDISRPEEMTLLAKKVIRPHQQSALDDVVQGFKTSERGKYISACGTGKTFTSLKIAEALVPDGGCALFLVPSISLLSQTIREWVNEADRSLNALPVCSDSRVSRVGGDEDISTHDLAFPATTHPDRIVKAAKSASGQGSFTVIFSTYHSIEAVAEAQSNGLPDFDLIICDEAHRTTGFKAEGDDESHFVRVHDQDFIRGQKRLYMTATPKIFSGAIKAKADAANGLLFSMDDEAKFGPELHTLGFSEAVERGLLCDYKVMVLAVDEKSVTRAFQTQIADANHEITLDDAVKITGCWNGLARRFGNADDEETDSEAPVPMKRAVAFSNTIKQSQRFTELFNGMTEDYRQAHGREKFLACEVDHVDGSHNALKRNGKLDWLRQDAEDYTCRILSNARCLSEGVDVPALDAVMFLNPRKSIVDVVQSVGRVMRRAPGKKYGYVILPIGIPSDIAPEEALKDHDQYKVVWQVLQALRAHDDRFDITVNQIELNQSRPTKIQFIGIGDGDGEVEGGGPDLPDSHDVQMAFHLPSIDDWRDAIFARIVEKCGDRRYWENWASDVSKIAERHMSRIRGLLDKPTSEHREAFDAFLAGLRENLNPNVSQDDAIEMLSQHLITKPVFEALFLEYSFAERNPVSISMEKILAVMDGQAMEKETEALDKFYKSVRRRAEGIDNAEGKQRIITELYENFFTAAFKKVADRLGIVYTPLEIVDFITHSADEALRKEFGVGFTDQGVHVLDPFTGTGTFMVRLLTSGLIRPEDIARKYSDELHCNEIVLLAYYIAAINVEEAYHGQVGGDYKAFPGIVLADTFQMTENEGMLDGVVFPENNERATRQTGSDIRVIIGNPPYSAGQSSANDDNQNLKYPRLDNSIRRTYAEQSSAKLKNSLYDSYIRAIRWASDRIEDRGLICYVTNGSFIDGNAADGLRKTLLDEFTSVYVFNLRGNARLQGEPRSMEGGGVFGSGSRTPVAITLLVRNPDHEGPHKLYYHDIGDYLSREQKLETVSDFGSLSGVSWKEVATNKHGDWINQRDPAFAKFLPLGSKGKGEIRTLFETYSSGIKSNRDAWVYNSSRPKLVDTISGMVTYFNQQVEAYRAACEGLAKNQRPKAKDFIDYDSTKLTWTRELVKDLSQHKSGTFDLDHVRPSMYRPFFKQWLYFDRQFNNTVYLMPSLFPTGAGGENLVIAVTGKGSNKPFSALLVDYTADLEMVSKGQCFPMYVFDDEEGAMGTPTFFEDGEEDNEQPFRSSAISLGALERFQGTYDDPNITADDLFFYVYGILHSSEYRKRFATTLHKQLPRIPYAKNFWAFSTAGRDLARWHLNYESVDPYPLDEVRVQLEIDPCEVYRVEKMRYDKVGKKEDNSSIIYNDHVTIGGIPDEAHEYIVNGKSALSWIMERYAVTTDKNSGITNDPNDWSDDPRYIFDLVHRIVRVSVETVKIVKNLPPLEEA